MCQIHTTLKSVTADTYYCVGDSDGNQSFTIFKSLIIYVFYFISFLIVCYAFWNNQRAYVRLVFKA